MCAGYVVLNAGTVGSAISYDFARNCRAITAVDGDDTTFQAAREVRRLQR